jgi:hypothetical protein
MAACCIALAGITLFWRSPRGGPGSACSPRPCPDRPGLRGLLHPPRVRLRAAGGLQLGHEHGDLGCHGGRPPRRRPGPPGARLAGKPEERGRPARVAAHARRHRQPDPDADLLDRPAGARDDLPRREGGNRKGPVRDEDQVRHRPADERAGPARPQRTDNPDNNMAAWQTDAARSSTSPRSSAASRSRSSTRA